MADEERVKQLEEALAKLLKAVSEHARRADGSLPAGLVDPFYDARAALRKAEAR